MTQHSPSHGIPTHHHMILVTPSPPKYKKKLDLHKLLPTFVKLISFKPRYYTPQKKQKSRLPILGLSRLEEKYGFE